MSFETAVASAVMSQIGKIEAPEMYQANSQFGGSLLAVFNPGAYGNQRSMYGDRDWFKATNTNPTLGGRLGQYGGLLDYAKTPVKSAARQPNNPLEHLQSIIPQNLYN
ncbi:hypothetical protein J4207_02140 [Candidatus Woesearchaeota archaeon]|nr:hypothetical protein [Candidatus Woesearchaeota archaeon]